jgi:hypothetical protein
VLAGWASEDAYPTGSYRGPRLVRAGTPAAGTAVWAGAAYVVVADGTQGVVGWTQGLATGAQG